MSLLERVRERFRASNAERGPLRAAAGLSRRGVARFAYERLDEISIVCDLDRLGAFPAASDFAMTEAVAGDADELARFALEHADAADAEKLRGYLRNGYLGHLARVEGRLVGYVWAVDAAVPADRTHPALRRFGFALDADEADSWDLYLAPAFRGGGRARATRRRTTTARCSNCDFGGRAA